MKETQQENQAESQAKKSSEIVGEIIDNLQQAGFQPSDVGLICIKRAQGSNLKYNAVAKDKKSKDIFTCKTEYTFEELTKPVQVLNEVLSVFNQETNQETKKPSKGNQNAKPSKQSN